MADPISNWLFDATSLTPHGFCLLWEPGLIWTHALSDLGIGLAYFSIPAALSVVAHHRRDLIFRPMFWLFAAFILLCGTTHFLAVLTLWVPAYGIEAIVKAVTATASLGTAVALWRLLPGALTLPSPEQLRLANLALQESEARHRANFERSPVPLHAVDEDGRITAVSDSWLRLLGYEREEVIGRPIFEFQPDFSPEVLHEVMQDERELCELERRFIRRDGETIDTLISVRSESVGGRSSAVAVVIDVTARRRAEEALRASEERLHQAQKMEAVGQLTGGVAHDFNNMLQGIFAGLDLLERRVAQGRAERASEYVAAIRQSAQRAAALTRRLLAFSHRQSLQSVPVELNTLARGLQQLIQRTVGPAVEVRLQLGEAVPQTLCDPNLLESAILNLAINARDAMPGGGTFTLTTTSQHVSPEELAGEPGCAAGEYVEIAASDTGTGMTPDVLARAFEPFFTTKPQGKGTGLGLSQLYGFVRQSGGCVQLESEVGKGTTVRLRLPRHDQPQSTSPEPTGKTVANRPTLRGTALVVDDEDVVRTLVAGGLQDLGMEVIEAEDGASALRALESDVSLDLLVTDIGMPGMNGRELAEKARRHRPGLPLILVTGYAGTALDEGRVPPGAVLMSKPFRFDDLARQVHEATQAASAA